MTALKVDIKNRSGENVGSTKLAEEVFSIAPNIHVMHEVCRAQMAEARQGTHDTKTRGQVSGGGRKPFRQKGTGRARQGSRRAPQWAGGGTAHGPQPRDYHQKTPKQMVQAALFGVLSDRARDGRIIVADTIVKGDAPSTKQAAAALAALSDYENLLVVLDRDDTVGWLSLRNLPYVHLIAADQLNAYDVVISDAVVFTRTALELFAAAKGAEVAVKVAKAPAKPAAAKKAEKEPAAQAVEAAAEVTDAIDAAEAPAKKTPAKKKVADVEAVVDEAEGEPAPVKKRAPAKKATAEPADEASEEETK